jgi:hypothetical protein
MNSDKIQEIDQMEQEIIKVVKKSFGKNLVSLLVEGSYGTDDYIKGYSDYDLLALVKKVDKNSEIDLSILAKKYSIDIQCSIKSYKDLLNRIQNNNDSSRFIGNIDLIKIKKQARLLAGKNIIDLVPDVRKIIKRDLGCELRADYYHATNSNPQWNIYKREPRKWANYIINMSNSLLLSKGIIVKKEYIPIMLSKYCPKFKEIAVIEEALKLRKSKKCLSLNKINKAKFKKRLDLFLAEYKRYTFI